MTKHLWILIVAAACKKDASPPVADPAPAPAAAPQPAPVAAAIPAPLSAALTLVNACKPDEDCPAMDALYDVAKELPPDVYRAAMKVATSKQARRALAEGVAGKLDEPLLLELERAADACPADGDCPAMDEFNAATNELTPALFRAGMKAAKTTDTKRWLIDSIRSRMDASLIADLAPLIGDDDLGRSAQMALAAKEDTDALAKLAALLDRHDRTDTIHSAVPDLLAKYPNNPSVKAALPKLREMAKKDAQGWGKANAAVAVGKIEGESAIPFLVEFIHTETWGPGRAAVADQLAAFKANKVALAELKKLGKDSDKDVSAAATKALK